MVYHPDAGLADGTPHEPDKARSVEIANAAAFSDLDHRAAWMVLHELAHAYHHHAWKADSTTSRCRAYERVKAAGGYEPCYGSRPPRPPYA